MTQPLEPSAGSHDLSWHVSERILFRFSFCYIVLYYVPYVLEAVPGTVLLVNWFSRSWILLVYGMVGVSAPLQPTGSGDTFSAYILQLVILILALVMGTHLIYFRPTQGQLYSSPRLITSVGTVRTCFCASLLRVFKSHSDTVYPSSKLAVGRKLWAVLPYGTALEVHGIFDGIYLFWRMCRTSPCGLSSVSAHRVARLPLSLCRHAKRRYAELLLRRSSEALLTQSPFALRPNRRCISGFKLTSSS
jgi:hypothetical protein